MDKGQCLAVILATFTAYHVLRLITDDGEICDFFANLIIAALAVALGIVTLTGCGGMVEDVAGELQPEMTIINYSGPESPSDCDDCPRGFDINGFQAVEIGPDTWGAGVNFPRGCPGAMVFESVTLCIFAHNGVGWTEVFSGPPGDGVCLGNLMIWQPLVQPCPGTTWCDLPDPWVGISLVDRAGFHYQFFTRPGGALPGQ